MAAWVTLTEIADETATVTLPVPPKELEDAGAAEERSFNVVGAGTHAIPVGRAQQTFPLSGTLYSEGRKELAFLQGRWLPASLVADQVRTWCSRGAKLRYETDTETDHLTRTVYVKSYRFVRVGARGDMTYEVQLVEWRIVGIKVDDGSASDGGSDQDAANDPDQPEGEAAVPVTYTVKAGDTLTLIARLLLGDSGRWRDLWEANRDTLGDSPDVIVPGQVLNVPGGTAPAEDEPVLEAAA